DGFDECKEEFKDETMVRRGTRIPCRDHGGFEWNHAREIPKTYGGAKTRPNRPPGNGGQTAPAPPPLSAWNGDEYLNGPQADRQMAGRTEPALHRVRERAGTEVLRRVALRPTSRAAARRSVAVAGHPRAVERTELIRDVECVVCRY